MNQPELDLWIDADVDLSVYGLRMQPFQPHADPRFLWLGARHRDGLAALRAAIARHAGVVVLEGAAGTGKTTLANALLDDLGGGVAVTAVRYPRLAPLDFLQVVAHGYRLRAAVRSREGLLRELGEFLAESGRAGRTVLLVIDEAHIASRQLLEEVAQLCSLGACDTAASALQVLLVGRAEVQAGLPEALAQRIGLRWTLEPMTAEETREYVAHRLVVAGSAGNPFTAEAVAEVWALSGGAPRAVNALCKRALATGGLGTPAAVGPDAVRAAATRARTAGTGRRGTGGLEGGRSGGRPLAVGLHRRRAAQVAAGLLLVALLAVAAGYFRSAGQGRPARGAAAPTLAAEPVLEARPPAPTAGTPTAGGGPAGALAGTVEPAAELARSGTEPATSSPRVPRPIPEPGSRTPTSARAPGAAGEGPLDGRLSPVTLRPIEVPPRLPAAPQSAPFGGAAPPRPAPSPAARPAPARDEPSGAARPTAPDEASQRADPDPTAVIDWLLKEYTSKRR